jgi:hypothetical protein
MRERRLTLDRGDAERRQRWAEEDRHLALAREHEQHEARLRAAHEATLEKTRLEAEARFERERLEAVHAHERRMAELEVGVRVRRLRQAVATLSVSCFLLVLGGVVVVLRAQGESQQLEEREGRAVLTSGCKP